METVFNLKKVNGEELTIKEIQEAMDRGDLTSRDLVMYYLYRIAQYDQSGPKINSVLEINPDAIFLAEAMDHERNLKGRRGPLHGIPILIKDNFDTYDKMHTSAGTLALENHISDSDAFVVRKLREAGAIILGKTNMTELANGMSTTMWAGYSARGGQVLNPYGPGEFFIGGSSSGSAAAASCNFAAASLGTETDASILSPAIQNSIVGIKPTTGLLSRSGIIPYTYSQDTPGPMARTVADAAILLGAMTGIDENDPATYKSEGQYKEDYTAYLDSEGLKGAKIGIFTDLSAEFIDSGDYEEELYSHAVQILKKAGAELFDSVEIPSFHRDWNWETEKQEFKPALGHYLNKLPAQQPVHTYEELIGFNEKNNEKALKYGQDKLVFKQQFENQLRNSEYIMSRLTDLHYSQTEGLDYAIDQNGLDAILFPGYICSSICAKSGYPAIALPAGYMAKGRPFGITMVSKPFNEHVLVKLGYAFEQASKLRKKPVLAC